MRSRWSKVVKAVDRGLATVQPLVQAAERVAPMIGASRPLAFAAVTLSTVAALRGIGGCKPADPESISGDARAIEAILRAASAAGIGRVVSEPHPGHAVREHEGCTWGVNDHWRFGPYGDPQPLLRALWEILGAAMVVTRHSNDRAQLRRDQLTGALPSHRAEAIASEAKALRAAGEPVGVLLSGPPGTGKSVIARWVAQELGGFSLRASLGEVDHALVDTLVRHLAPRTVLVDDIDRGSTAHALDLAEHLTAAGVVVIATCNEPGAVDPALRRARRLGLHYAVEQIEGHVLDAVLDGLDVPSDVRARLERMPVAVARDYAGHHRALGPARALEVLRERDGGADG